MNYPFLQISTQVPVLEFAKAFLLKHFKIGAAYHDQKFWPLGA